LYSANGLPSNTVVAFYDKTQQVFILDFYVRQATGIAYNASITQPNGTFYSGGNNIIQVPALGATGGVLENAQLSIEQYQAQGGTQGMTKATDRVVYLNNSGNPTIPV
jgi:hypothetical protein